MDIPQISFGGGTISPATYARVDLQKFGSAMADMTNFFVHAEGGASNRAGFQFIKEVKDSTKRTRLIPFRFSESQAYALEFGDQYMRVINNGGIVLETAVNITAATKASPVEITANSHGFLDDEQVYITGVGGMTELNGKFYTVANKTTNTFELAGVDGSSFTTYTSGGTVARVFTLPTSYTEAQLPYLKYRQSNDIMYITHPSHAPAKLARTGHDAWTLTTITFEPSQAAPTSPSISNEGTAQTTTYSYKITAVNEETAEESLPLDASTSTGNATLSETNFNRITFTAASGAGSYNVYKEDNGVYGKIGYTETTTFDDTNLATDLNDTPPKARTPFTGSGNYPSAVGLHEQRTVWGGPDNNPLNTYMSQTGQYENMNVSSPTKDTDAVTFRIPGDEGSEIRHYRSFEDRLLIFTSGAVRNVRPGGDVDAITPSSKKLGVEDYIGATHVPPIIVKKNILMVSGQANQGFEVHSLGYNIQQDSGNGGYVGSDMTVLARHLFEGYTIEEWVYAHRPYKLICAVRSDGKMLVQTYLQEHQVFAWTLWKTDGEVESVCTVPEGQEDALYAIVKRMVNGSTVRYIERLHTRNFTDIEDAFFVDSGLTYEGSATTSITGLDHLEGEPVIALSDGNLVTGLTVSGGGITLPNAASKVHVGLPYAGYLQTLPINVVKLATMSKRKNVQSLAVRVLKTRGMYAGPSLTNLEEVPSRSNELWGDPAALKSEVVKIQISGDWKRDKYVHVKTEPGLPMTVLSIIPDLDAGN